MASDGSSSVSSNNGLNDKTKTSASSWTTISGITDAHFVQSLENVVHGEELNEDIIEDVITNDMIIINGADLDHSDNEMIAHCNFDKTNGQTTIDSYFVDQETQSHQHHIRDANDRILIESNLSNLSNAILNDSSNEVNVPTFSGRSVRLWFLFAHFLCVVIDIHQKWPGYRTVQFNHNKYSIGDINYGQIRIHIKCDRRTNALFTLAHGHRH